MKNNREYKAKLKATREADKRHEEAMLELFDGDENALKAARNKATRVLKDEAFMKQILKRKRNDNS